MKLSVGKYSSEYQGQADHRWPHSQRLLIFVDQGSYKTKFAAAALSDLSRQILAFIAVARYVAAILASISLG